MKRYFLLLLFLPLLMAMTCDDDPDYPHIGLQGEWKLVGVSGGFEGTSYDITEESVSWTFSESYRTVFIVNNNEQDLYTGLTSRNYTYTIEPAEVCDETITVDSTDFGCVLITGDTLRLSQSHSDGRVLIFAR